MLLMRRHYRRHRLGYNENDKITMNQGDCMSIRNKLILSNIALIIVPILSIFIVDFILAFFMLVVFNNDASTFTTYRFISFIVVVVIVNVTLSFILSKNIIKPILKLNAHTSKIGEGNLDEPVDIKRNDEIGELAASYESMRIALKDAREKEEIYFKNRQELMAGMSHDLKTPLTSIKGYVNGIEDGVADTPEKLARYTSVIQQSVSRLESMIDDLFMYSKLDLEEVDFNFTKVDLESFLKDIINEYELEFSDTESINFRSDENEYIVRADRQQLYRAISNIIDNSIKYSDKENTEINILLTAKESVSVIDIEDNGMGMDAGDINQAFNSFYRTDRSRNSGTGGSGLGLSIVKRIIDKHEGEAFISSRKGQGTTVSIKLKQVNENE